MISTDLQVTSIFHRLWAMLFWKKKIKVAAQPTYEKQVWELGLVCEPKKSVLAAIKGRNICWKVIQNAKSC